MLKKHDSAGATRQEQIIQKEQILAELQRVEKELKEKGPVAATSGSSGTGSGTTSGASTSAGYVPPPPPPSSAANTVQVRSFTVHKRGVRKERRPCPPPAGPVSPPGPRGLTGARMGSETALARGRSPGGCFLRSSQRSHVLPNTPHFGSRASVELLQKYCGACPEVQTPPSFSVFLLPTRC